jgi:hypothetical protein
MYITPVMNALHQHLQRFDDLGWGHGELGLEHPVPETAGDTEAVLVIGKMVCQVVFLQLTPVSREARICQLRVFTLQKNMEQLTSCGARSNESNRSKRIQRYHHRRLQWQRSSHRRKRRERDTRRE